MSSRDELTVRFSVIKLSQPLIVCRVSVYVPVCVNSLPLKLKLVPALIVCDMVSAWIMFSKFAMNVVSCDNVIVRGLSVLPSFHAVKREQISGVAVRTSWSQSVYAAETLPKAGLSDSIFKSKLEASNICSGEK